MFKLKLYFLAFCFSFISTAALCFLLKMPLIFLPISYGVGSFFEFSLLLGFLNFCLIFITLPLVKFTYQKLKTEVKEIAFYIIAVLLILQVVTMLTGYAESHYTNKHGDPLYYYKGIGNSGIYIVIGNITATLTSILFARKEMMIKNEIEPSFEFESDKNFR